MRRPEELSGGVGTGKRLGLTKGQGGHWQAMNCGMGSQGYTGSYPGSLRTHRHMSILRGLGKTGMAPGLEFSLGLYPASVVFRKGCRVSGSGKQPMDHLLNCQ